jgi:hypothetical protein
LVAFPAIFRIVARRWVPIFWRQRFRGDISAAGRLGFANRKEFF